MDLIYNMIKNNKTKSEDTEIKRDYLEVDPPIPGQNFVLISYVHPDEVCKKKEIFLFKNCLLYAFKNKIIRETLLSMDENELEKTLTYEKADDIWKDFLVTNEEPLSKQFDEENNFQTSTIALKIRGVYESLQEARDKAKRMRERDSSFDIYVSQVGYWLPIDPRMREKVLDKEYAEEDLNKIIKKHQENQSAKDKFFEENKNEKLKKAEEENKKAKEKINVVNPDKNSKEKIKEMRNIVDEKLKLTIENTEKEIEEKMRKNRLINHIQNSTTSITSETKPPPEIEKKEKVEQPNEKNKKQRKKSTNHNVKVKKIEESSDIFQDDDPWMKQKMDAKTIVKKIT